MGKTSIEWTDRSANPIRARNTNTGRWGWYCVLKSPGCANCYAQTLNMRFGTKLPYQARSADQIEIRFDPRPMEAILRLRKKHQRIFLCDMTDLFGEFVPDAMIDRAFAYMALAREHTFQVLTKRPDRALTYLMRGESRVCESGQIWCDTGRRIHKLACEIAEEQRRLGRIESDSSNIWPLPNVWLGVSVEDQQRADERIPILLQIPAAVRFLSVEPLLGPIDLGAVYCTKALDWVIVGGESGPNARPCDLAWIRSIVGQCRDAGVACFVKQLGSRPFDSADRISIDAPESHARALDLDDKKGGNPDEWPEDLRVREFPR